MNENEQRNKETLDLTYRISQQDFIHFNYNQFNNWKVKMILIILSIPVLLNLILRHNIGESDVNIFSFSYLAVFIFPAFVIVLIYFSSRNAYRKNNFLQGEINLKMNTKAIRFSGKGFDSSIDFEKIVKISKKKRYYLVYTSPQIANIIPKDQFSEGQKQQFEKLIHSIPNLKITN